MSVVAVVALLGYGLSVPPPAEAGGPLLIGGRFGIPGAPFTWDTSVPIPYRTDGGNLGPLTNDQANQLVQQMFQVWQDVPTAAIAYTRLGQIQGVTGGDVVTPADFNAVACPQSGSGSGQNPIIYDADGSLFQALGFSSRVIGFAGPQLISSSGRIVCALAALNGKFLLGSPPLLSQDQFAAAFIHEFGHFSGLDHSQINTTCLSGPTFCGPNSDTVLGLPTMFPILLPVTEPGGVPAQKTLAADDIAWISRLYPETVNNPPTQVPFSSTHGTISGKVFFSDGVTHAQGVNVIARNVNAPQKTAVSVVSGYLYTGDRGQDVTGHLGSRFGSLNPQLAGAFDIPVPAGQYTLEVEAILSGFTDGSRVGPLDPPIDGHGNTPPGPVGPSFAVTAGSTSTVNITLQGTPSRFDALESATLQQPEPFPLWLREEPGLAVGEAA